MKRLSAVLLAALMSAACLTVHPSAGSAATAGDRGELYTWGKNTGGQLGNGRIPTARSSASSLSTRLTPVEIRLPEKNADES